MSTEMALWAQLVALKALMDEDRKDFEALRKRVDKLDREHGGLVTRDGLPYSPAFLAFWDAYACPRRRNKPAAWREWRRLRLDHDANHLLAIGALAAYKLTEQWQTGFQPEPARWLKSEPWLDEPTVSPPAGQSQNDDWVPRTAAKRGPQ